MKRWNVLGIVLLVVLAASCANPTGPGNTGGDASDPLSDGDGSVPAIDIDSDDGSVIDTGTGGSSDGSVTITFVLDMDAGSGVTLSTIATAPVPITVMAGEPVRLTQGMGFTATGPGPGGPDSTTFHASGWSTLVYSEQFAKIYDPSSAAPSDGWYLPGFEASFAEDTTLYARWLPEADNIAARITFKEPGSGARTVEGPVLHLRDVLPFERASYFQNAVSVPWTVSSGERVWEWASATNTFFNNAHNVTPGAPAVWQFADASSNGTNSSFLSSGNPGLQDVRITYTSQPVYTITFDPNGGTASSGTVTREAFADQPIANNRTWWAMSSANRLDDPTRGALTFDTWYLDPVSGSADWFENATADTTLHARWQANVSFDLMNGFLLSGSSASIDVNVDSAGVAIVSNPPGLATDYWEHDVFAGWFTEQVALEGVPNQGVANRVSTGSASTDPVTLTNVTGDVTLYAGWGPKYSVGEDLPSGGGTVFYILGGSEPQRTMNHPNFIAAEPNNWRYLAVAPENATASPGYAEGWSAVAFSTQPGVDVLGGGRAATNAIRGASGQSPTQMIAARQADQYTSGTYSDWYLPTVVELIELANATAHDTGESVWTSVGMLTGGGAEQWTRQYWTSASYDGGHGYSGMGGKAFSLRLPSPGVDPIVENPAITLSGTNSPFARPVRRF